jgi:RND family efflux transporter MFP subunit
MKTKVIIISIAIVLVVAATFKLKSNKHIVEANIYRPDPEKKVLVQAYVAELKSFEKTFSYTGTFAPFREVMLVPQLHGEVDGIYFNEGDQVNEGKLLVQIDDDLLQAQFISADASYKNAKRNLERHNVASQSGGVSRIQLDNYELNLTNAEAQRKQLAKQIELSRITAPFSGTITLRDVEPGSVVGSSPVARITDLSQLKLEISIPEKEVMLFKEGETAGIQTELYPGKTLFGKIEYVADRGDEAHNYAVRILIKNTEPSTLLKVGMYGTALMNKGLKQQALVIPRAALLGSAKNPQVFIVKNNKAILQNIQTGRSNNEYVEVLQGIQQGDEVVTGGHINLADQSNVQVAN